MLAESLLCTIVHIHNRIEICEYHNKMNSLILFTLLFVSVALAQPLHRFTSNGEYSGVLSRMIEPDEPSQSLALWVPFNVKNIAVTFSDPVDSHNYVPYIQFNSRKLNTLYLCTYFI